MFYMADNGTNWSATQRKYIEWLSTPIDARQPLKHSMLAQELKVGERSLYRWRTLPGFYAEVNKLVDEHLADDYSEIMDSFKREARRGSFQHQKTYFEMLGKYTPKQEITGKDGAPLGIALVEVVRPAQDE